MAPKVQPAAAPGQQQPKPGSSSLSRSSSPEPPQGSHGQPLFEQYSDEARGVQTRTPDESLSTSSISSLPENQMSNVEKKNTRAVNNWKKLTMRVQQQEAEKQPTMMTLASQLLHQKSDADAEGKNTLIQQYTVLIGYIKNYSEIINNLKLIKSNVSTYYTKLKIKIDRNLYANFDTKLNAVLIQIDDIINDFNVFINFIRTNDDIIRLSASLAVYSSTKTLTEYKSNYSTLLAYFTKFKYFDVYFKFINNKSSLSIDNNAIKFVNNSVEEKYFDIDLDITKIEQNTDLNYNISAYLVLDVIKTNDIDKFIIEQIDKTIKSGQDFNETIRVINLKDNSQEKTTEFLKILNVQKYFIIHNSFEKIKTMISQVLSDDLALNTLFTTCQKYLRDQDKLIIDKVIKTFNNNIDVNKFDIFKPSVIITEEISGLHHLNTFNANPLYDITTRINEAFQIQIATNIAFNINNVKQNIKGTYTDYFYYNELEDVLKIYKTKLILFLQNYCRYKLRETFNKCIENVNKSSVITLKDKVKNFNNVFNYENVMLDKLHDDFIIPVEQKCNKLKSLFNNIKTEILASDTIDGLDKQLHFNKINIKSDVDFKQFILNCKATLFYNMKLNALDELTTLNQIALALNTIKESKIRTGLNSYFNHTKITKENIIKKNNLEYIKKSFTFDNLDKIKSYLDFTIHTISDPNFILFKNNNAPAIQLKKNGGAYTNNCRELNTRNVSATYTNNIENTINFIFDDSTKLNKDLLNINFNFWEIYNKQLNVKNYSDYINKCVNIYINADVFVAKLITQNNSNVSFSLLDLDLSQFKFSNQVKYYLVETVSQNIVTNETWNNMLTDEKVDIQLQIIPDKYNTHSKMIIDLKYFNGQYTFPSSFVEKLQSLTPVNLQNLKQLTITNKIQRFRKFKNDNIKIFNNFFNQEEIDDMDDDFKNFAIKIEEKLKFVKAQNKLLEDKFTKTDLIIVTESDVKPFENMLTTMSKADYTEQIKQENRYDKFINILDEYDNTLDATKLEDRLTTKINNAIDLIRQTRCKLEIAYEVCENRRKEGLFINNSLAGVRSIILESIDAGANIPDYSSFCSKMYCDFTNNTKCFSGSKSGDMDKKVQASSDVIFKQLAKEFGLANASAFAKDMQVCIFCVFNMSKLGKDTKFAPYIDVNYFKHLINSV